MVVVRTATGPTIICSQCQVPSWWQFQRPFTFPFEILCGLLRWQGRLTMARRRGIHRGGMFHAM